MRSLRSRYIFLAVFWVVFCLSHPAGAQSARETPVVKVVQENASSVVNIATERILLLEESPYWGDYGSEFDYFFNQFFGYPRRQRALKLNSVGSGVIVDAGGLIVTNAHVIHMASNVFVVLNDGTSVEGKVVYESLEDDLAMVKIDPPEALKAIKLGTTEDIMIGETVVAIGDPLGFENSVTAGVISGKERELTSREGVNVMEGLLQTDAPINPGNSGGALLNLDGELVGINVAVVQNSQSIGFAIPVEKVKNALRMHNENRSLAVKYRKGPVSPQSLSGQAQAAPLNPSGSQEEDQWDPFAEMRRMTEEMDRMFQGAFGRGGGSPGTGMFNSDIFYDSDFDIEDKGDRYIVNVQVAGVDQDKIDIEIHDGALTVSGEYSAVEKEENPNGYYSSHSAGSFLRTIPLPADADTQNVKTDVNGDVITITLPKKS